MLQGLRKDILDFWNENQGNPPKYIDDLYKAKEREKPLTAEEQAIKDKEEEDAKKDKKKKKAAKKAGKGKKKGKLSPEEEFLKKHIWKGTPEIVNKV
mmetsp:Transcript_136664/g.193286  ORF Transcript_136664/g.193286 Transcript_136664/m.193286 type:complete len:97 (+) Transcript_136664:41-331(+)